MKSHLKSVTHGLWIFKYKNWKKICWLDNATHKEWHLYNKWLNKMGKNPRKKMDFNFLQIIMQNWSEGINY